MISLITIFIIILIFAIGSAIVVNSCNDPEDSYIRIFFTMLGAVLFMLCGGILTSIENYNKIPAIDVYRGNTTLQITYQDSVPVDSVVVFKNNKL